MPYRNYMQLYANELAHELTPNSRIKDFTTNSAVIGAYAESTVNDFVQKMVSPLNVSTGTVISPDLYGANSDIPQIDTIIWQPNPLPGTWVSKIIVFYSSIYPLNP